MKLNRLHPKTPNSARPIIPMKPPSIKDYNIIDQNNLKANNKKHNERYGMVTSKSQTRFNKSSVSNLRAFDTSTPVYKSGHKKSTSLYSTLNQDKVFNSNSHIQNSQAEIYTISAKDKNNSLGFNGHSRYFIDEQKIRNHYKIKEETNKLIMERINLIETRDKLKKEYELLLNYKNLLAEELNLDNESLKVLYDKNSISISNCKSVFAQDALKNQNFDSPKKDLKSTGIYNNTINSLTLSSENTIKN